MAKMMSGQTYKNFKFIRREVNKLANYFSQNYFGGVSQMVLTIALMGGLFAVLAFIHFFVDWIFQSHAEAMVKHNNP